MKYIIEFIRLIVNKSMSIFDFAYVLYVVNLVSESGSLWYMILLLPFSIASTVLEYMYKDDKTL